MSNLSDLYNEKLQRLQEAYALENDPSVKFKLEKQIESTKNEMADQGIPLKKDPADTAEESPATESTDIFISYAWGGASEQMVDTLDRTLQDTGLTIIRDKRNLGYKGGIQEFMEEIGRGGAIIVVISDKYLKSPNCMFELVQIAKNGDFADRIFPIVLGDAKIYDPLDRLDYVQYWEQKLGDFDAKLKTVSAANMQGFREEIDQFDEIKRELPRLAAVLKDMNTLTPDMHIDDQFATLIDTLQQRLDL